MQKILNDVPAKQTELIHVLHRVQEEIGYIPAEAVTAIARHLKISEGEIYGVLTFYKAFSLQPRGKHVVTICMGTACHVRGAPRILDEFCRELGIKAGQTTEDGYFTLETVACLGCCAIGPVVVVDEYYHAQVSIRKVASILEPYRKERDNGKV